MRHVADEYMMNVKLRPAPTRVNAILGYPCVMVRNGYCTPIFFSVNKWNRFQDTSGLHKMLTWLSCGARGGGGTRGVRGMQFTSHWTLRLLVHGLGAEDLPPPHLHHHTTQSVVTT